MVLVVVFVLVVFAYSLFSRYLARTVITGPIVFTAAGILVPFLIPGSFGKGFELKPLLFIAEMGLVFLLFTDASRISLRELKSLNRLPARLLSIGMLLTILLGALMALLVFPGLSIWEAGVLSAILAPTDAGLGQVIVSSPRVPVRIRNSLNVEAGLNDGMSVPFMMFFFAMAESSSAGSGILRSFLIEQLGYGALIGAGIGLAGGFLLGWADRKGLMEKHTRQLALVALPVFSMILSGPTGASMFIVAFVAGMVSRIGYKEVGENSLEFTEGWGQILNFFVFFFLGLMTSRGLSLIRLDLVVYAILSLTLVRMFPVAIALIGTRLKPATVLFMGWFGPRGLASVVLGLVYIELEGHLPGVNRRSGLP
jgi:sodium/hydrogen antiporter